MDGVSRLVELYIVDKVKGRRDETRRGNPEQQARPESGRVWFACTGLGWAGLGSSVGHYSAAPPSRERCTYDNMASSYAAPHRSNRRRRDEASSAKLAGRRSCAKREEQAEAAKCFRRERLRDRYYSWDEGFSTASRWRNENFGRVPAERASRHATGADKAPLDSLSRRPNLLVLPSTQPALSRPALCDRTLPLMDHGSVRPINPPTQTTVLTDKLRD